MCLLGGVLMWVLGVVTFYLIFDLLFWGDYDFNWWWISSVSGLFRKEFARLFSYCTHTFALGGVDVSFRGHGLWSNFLPSIFWGDYWLLLMADYSIPNKVWNKPYVSGCSLNLLVVLTKRLSLEKKWCHDCPSVWDQLHTVPLFTLSCDLRHTIWSCALCEYRLDLSTWLWSRPSELLMLTFSPSVTLKYHSLSTRVPGEFHK